MSTHKGQQFLAYRACSDEFEIKFFGGPLDGAHIVTDVFPDAEAFTHHVRGRHYIYRYKRMSKSLFHAVYKLAAKLAGEH